MELGLGIDAGGTYTDAVVIDFTTQSVIAKAKALTTKDDLSRGVRMVIEQLPTALLPRVQLVSLSTTLATNAIVEGKGGKVGVLLLGFDEHDLARVHHRPRRAIPGRTDITGQEIEPLDEQAVRRAVTELLKQEHVEAFAVSGMVSVKNPIHEQRAKEIIAEVTDKPIVCGHELSTQLDTIKRTATATLNARLLPIIADLIAHIKTVLGDVGILAPLMVVRGDGTLMSEATTRACPVETILSGPAASVCGAQFLSGVQHGLVVDIGGTTSDIALFIDGQPVIAESGARVADWSTLVRAVDIDTMGLGGDSAVTLTPDGRLCLGPRRAIPLALLAHMYPHIAEEVQRLWKIRKQQSQLIQPVECYVLVNAKYGTGLSASESRTVAALADGPLSRERLAERIGVANPSLVPVASLETQGIIQRSTLTPADILHCQGIFTAWHCETAEFALTLFADRAGVSPEEFSAFVIDTFAHQLTRYLLHRLLRHPQAVQDFPIGPADRPLVDMMTEQTQKLGFSLEAHLDSPIIAIGAPAYALTGKAASRLHARLICPEHAEVANAVGAITGTHTLMVEATICPGEDGYLVHSPTERRKFTSLDAAKDWAHLHVQHLLDEQIAGTAIEGFTFHNDIQSFEKAGDSTRGTIFLECRIRATAVNKPEFNAVAKVDN